MAGPTPPRPLPPPARPLSARSQRGSARRAALLVVLLLALVVGLALTVSSMLPSADRWNLSDVLSDSKAVPQHGQTTITAQGQSSLQHNPYVNFANATDYAGRVIRVGDGDGVEFQTAKGVLKIRLDSVDAPEVGDGKKRPGQPFARESRDHLKQWLASRTITARCFEQDQYGRPVCALIDQNGESAGRAQVAAGFAWAYTAARGKYLRDPQLIELQEKAKKLKVGLWQQANPDRPWQWRYDCWQKQQCHPR